MHDDIIRENEIAEKEFQVWLGQQPKLIREMSLAEQRELWHGFRREQISKIIQRIAKKSDAAFAGWEGYDA